MSLVTLPLRKNAQAPTAAILCDVGERLTGILASQRRLAQSPTIDFHARRRLEAVIAQLIEALDALDGEPDREQTATETAGAGFHLDRFPDDAECGCDIEALSDDNGLADPEGALEQEFLSIGSARYG